MAAARDAIRRFLQLGSALSFRFPFSSLTPSGPFLISRAKNRNDGSHSETRQNSNRRKCRRSAWPRTSCMYLPVISESALPIYSPTTRRVLASVFARLHTGHGRAARNPFSVPTANPARVAADRPRPTIPRHDESPGIPVRSRSRKNRRGRGRRRAVAGFQAISRGREGEAALSADRDGVKPIIIIVRLP